MLLRKLCWWAIPCCAAILISVNLLPESLLIPVGMGCVLFSLASPALHGKGRLKLLLVCLGLAVGFLWTGCYGFLFRDPAHALGDNEVREYTLEVTEYPEETEWGAVLNAKLSLAGTLNPKVSLYVGRDALSLRPGDIVTAHVKLSPSDFRHGEHIDYYQTLGIYLLGSVRGEIVLRERPAQLPIRYWPQWTANGVKDSIRQIFQEDVSGFLVALVTGDKSLLPTGLYAAFRRSGIAHIIAVSGLHISFLAAAISLLFKRRSPLSFLCVTLLIFFFAAAAGNSPSALRAAIMTTVILLAPLLGREDDKPTTLSAILVFFLLVRPYAVASVSLQLSFSSVAGIHLITTPLCHRWLDRIPKWKSVLGKLLRGILTWIATTLAVTLGALLFSIPISALVFHSVSLVGPLTNLLTLWAVSGTFMAGLLCALIGLISPMAAIVPARLTAWPARLVIWVAETISHLPFASLSLGSVYLIGWFLAAYFILLLWLFGRKETRPLIPLSVIGITLCAALLLNVLPSHAGALTVAALDVGQGASTLLYSKGHAVLVDCGGNAGDDPGDIAADYLQSLGTSRLDALILTHYHSDHAGGVPELLSRIKVSMLILPDVTPEEPLRQEILLLAKKYGCDVQLLKQDAHVTFGDASLEIYEPLGSGGANEEGLSVLCTAGDFDALITGDMNDVVERRLVKYKTLPDIELLMVGHHGSRTSTSEELLLATTPEIAVISSGYNTYGHPAPEALERLGAAGCEIYRTDQMGNITFTVKGD